MEVCVQLESHDGGVCAVSHMMEVCVQLVT